MVLDRDCEKVRRKILQASAKLFLSIGYNRTTIIKIAEEAKVNRGSVIYAFKNKENIVCDLVADVLEYQFQAVKSILKDKAEDKLLLYASETTLQLYLAESSEHMREMYCVSYSMPNSANIIYHTITAKLKDVFSDDLPNWEPRDFFEREISSAGIMRNHISVPCDIYFTMERKIKSFLESTFLLYHVPQKRIEESIHFVLQFDWKNIANKVLDKMLSYLQSKA